MLTLSVTETIHHLKTGEYIIRQPKSKHGKRNIALSPSLAILLREYKTQQENNRRLLGRELQDTDLVFSHLDGAPIRPASVSRLFRTVAKSVGLSNLRFHDLRHTHATLMLQQGTHPKIVSERLGHSSIAITLDTYSHVLPGLQEAAAKRFEEGLQQVFEKYAESKDLKIEKWYMWYTTCPKCAKKYGKNHVAVIAQVK